ncbi:MAG: ABC transporter permease [Kiritimatiellae bacterium]|nr:ABC transporter permease [Kiritimatiellia bacterium]
MTPFTLLDLRQRQRRRLLPLLAGLLLLLPLVFLLGLSATTSDPFDPADAGAFLAVSALAMQFVAMALLAPIGAADRFSREFEQRTIDALLNSPATPARIFGGKYLAALVFALFLWALFLPPIAFAALWGGYPAWNYALFALANLLVGAYLTLLALSASARSQRALHSFLRLGACFILFLVLLPTLASLLMAGSNPDAPPTLLAWPFLAPNPFILHFWLLDVFSNARHALRYPLGPWFLPSVLLAWLLLSLLSFRLALRSLRPR